MNDNSTDFPLQNKKHGVDINLNSQNFIEGPKKEAQKVINALSINTSELDWNHFIGINQQDMVLNSHNQQALNSMIHYYLKKMFGKTIAFSQVNNLRFDDKNRIAYFNLKVVVNTDNGQETVNPSFSLNGGD